MAMLQQRVTRFLEEDAGAFLFTSTLMSGVYAAREFHHAPTAMPVARRLQQAVRKTAPLVPAFAISAAVGIVGMKVTLAGVQDARRDYSRTSVLVAMPLFTALLHAPLGPRAMAKSAIGYGAFVVGVDYAATKWHHHRALLHDPSALGANKNDALLGHHDNHHVFMSHGYMPDPSALVVSP